ncbi:MAG: RsfS/YbeB/iojap family protein [Thermoanaerobaculia bacterium]
MLLDYGDFLVHALLDERRQYYALERLWRDAPEVTADFIRERRAPGGRGLPRRSPALSAGLVGLEAAASSDSPALVLGEPGTGRSTLARLLHGGGRRAAAPLVEMDPATSPASALRASSSASGAGCLHRRRALQAGRVARPKAAP